MTNLYPKLRVELGRWKFRAKEIADIVNKMDYPFVHDLGCGTGHLRTLLKNKFYIGYDAEPHFEGIVRCDFNERFPKIRHGKINSRVAVACGVMEYIINVSLFISEVSKRFNTFVCTYHIDNVPHIVKQVPLHSTQEIMAFLKRDFESARIVCRTGCHVVFLAKKIKLRKR